MINIRTQLFRLNGKFLSWLRLFSAIDFCCRNKKTKLIVLALTVLASPFVAYDDVNKSASLHYTYCTPLSSLSILLFVSLYRPHELTCDESLISESFQAARIRNFTRRRQKDFCTSKTKLNFRFNNNVGYVDSFHKYINVYVYKLSL